MYILASEILNINIQNLFTLNNHLNLNKKFKLLLFIENLECMISKINL